MNFTSTPATKRDLRTERAPIGEDAFAGRTLIEKTGSGMVGTYGVTASSAESGGDITLHLDADLTVSVIAGHGFEIQDVDDERWALERKGDVGYAAEGGPDTPVFDSFRRMPAHRELPVTEWTPTAPEKRFDS